MGPLQSLRSLLHSLTLVLCRVGEEQSPQLKHDLDSGKAQT